MSLEIVAVALDSPAAAGLIEAVQQEYVTRYGGRDQTPMDPAEFAPPGGGFLLAELAGVPVGCGGFRTVDDGVAELKRMYVAVPARGQGVARRLLQALEEAAAAAGCDRVILETGTQQPEAIGLYTSSGYRPVPGFGIHRCHDHSRHFGKSVDSRLPATRRAARMPA